MRVNISEPGHEHKETIKSASMSAASGGITSMICMPPIFHLLSQYRGLKFLLD